MGIRASDHWIFLGFCLLLFEGIFTCSKMKKVIKKSQNIRNQGFSYDFCLMIEGSGSVPLTNGSGSRRPKNIRYTEKKVCLPRGLLHYEVENLLRLGVTAAPGKPLVQDGQSCSTRRLGKLLRCSAHFCLFYGCLNFCTVLWIRIQIIWCP